MISIPDPAGNNMLAWAKAAARCLRDLDRRISSILPKPSRPSEDAVFRNSPHPFQILLATQTTAGEEEGDPPVVEVKLGVNSNSLIHQDGGSGTPWDASAYFSAPASNQYALWDGRADGTGVGQFSCPAIGGLIYLEMLQTHEAQIEWNDPDELRIGLPFNIAVFDTPQDQLTLVQHPPEPDPEEYLYARTARIPLAAVVSETDTRPGWTIDLGTPETPDKRKIIQRWHHDMRLSHWAINGYPTLWADTIGRQYNP